MEQTRIITRLIVVMALTAMFFSQALSQSQLGRYSGSYFVIEDSSIKAEFNRNAGWQLDRLTNKHTNYQYLRGNGYYFLGSFESGPDTNDRSYKQSHDSNAMLNVIENTVTKIVIETNGQMYKSNGTPGNVQVSTRAYSFWHYQHSLA